MLDRLRVWRHLSSGGVLQWLADVDPSVETQQQKMLDFYRDWLSFLRCSFPIICALNGAAIGAAAVFASACDLRVASGSASISVPFTSLGIHPGMATTWFLERSLSPGLSADLLLTGRTLSGEELQMSGFVNQNVSAEELMPTAISLAKAISRTSQVATQATLASIREPLPTLDASLERDAARQARSMYDEEFRTRISRLIKR